MKEVDPERGVLEQNYEISRCAAWVAEIGAHKICLQFPDELLADSFGVSQALAEMTGQSVFILGDTSYGRCVVMI